MGFLAGPTDGDLYMAAITMGFADEAAFHSDRDAYFTTAIRAWPELADTLSGGHCHVNKICSGAVDCGAMAMDQLCGVGISGGSVERGNLTPDREALIYFGSPLGRAEPMPSWSKVRGDAAEGRRNRWACRTDLKRFIARSRCRVG